MDHKLPGYETAIDLLIIVSQWLPRRSTGKSDNLTDHFTNIEIHTCTHTFFLMFQQLGDNGSTVNLMPINLEFLQLQFDTRRSSVLRKKNTQEKRTRIRPSYTTSVTKPRGVWRKFLVPPAAKSSTRSIASELQSIVSILFSSRFQRHIAYSKGKSEFFTTVLMDLSPD